MAAELDLAPLLRHMKPELRPGIFVFCIIAPNERIPAALNPC